jgi:hypothetical protein
MLLLVNLAAFFIHSTRRSGLSAGLTERLVSLA